MTLSDLTRTDFEVHLHGGFQVNVDGFGTLTLELVEVAALGMESARPDGRQPFSLIFRGPCEPILAQQTCRLAHEAMGELDLFVVPLGPDRAGGIRYEAIFA